MSCDRDNQRCLRGAGAAAGIPAAQGLAAGAGGPPGEPVTTATVCGALRRRLEAVGFRFAEEDLAGNLQAVLDGCIVFPQDRTLSDEAFLDYADPGVEDAIEQLTANIADVIRDAEKQEFQETGSHQLGEGRCTELGRKLFRMLAGELRPDLFDPAGVKVDDEFGVDARAPRADTDLCADLAMRLGTALRTGAGGEVDYQPVLDALGRSVIVPRNAVVQADAGYNGALDADSQISSEEAIAERLFYDTEWDDPEDRGLSAIQMTRLARAITTRAAARLRPDLFVEP